MTSKTVLTTLFGLIFLALLCTTTWASLHQSMFAWTGLTSPPNRYWTIATMTDAYFGFITFYVWVFYKEQRAFARIGWFIGIMLLGNMAMSAYVLLQLRRLRPGDPPAIILSAQNP